MVERRGGWWLPLVAAGAVVTVAAGVAVVLNTRGGDQQPAAAGPAPTGAVGSAGQVVRDGDRVTGRGQVVALPGRPVQLCAPYATILI